MGNRGLDRSPEEKWQIVQEGIKTGNEPDTCRRHAIAPNPFYRFKDRPSRGLRPVQSRYSPKNEIIEGGNPEPQ